MSRRIKDLAERFFNLYDAKHSGEMFSIFMFAATLIVGAFLLSVIL